MPVAYMPHLNQISLLQLDGILSSDQFKECLDKALTGCKLIYEIQRSALMKKYFGSESEEIRDEQ
jgi:exosome complex component RRP41